MLTNIKMQIRDSSCLQMFDSEKVVICRCLPILCPSSVPRSHYRRPKTKGYQLTINNLHLQILHSASENKKTAPMERLFSFHCLLSHCLGQLISINLQFFIYNLQIQCCSLVIDCGSCDGEISISSTTNYCDNT